jgi:hypothetical protein
VLVGRNAGMRDAEHRIPRFGENWGCHAAANGRRASFAVLERDRASAR